MAAELSKLLSESDPGAGDYLEAHQASLRPFFEDAVWKELGTMVQNYAFAEAQGHVDRVLATLRS
jgi:hypothetical protein